MTKEQFTRFRAFLEKKIYEFGDVPTHFWITRWPNSPDEYSICLWLTRPTLTRFTDDVMRYTTLNADRDGCTLSEAQTQYLIGTTPTDRECIKIPLQRIFYK